MSVFWIAAALMVFAALGFLVWPLSRGQERAKHDSRAINVALYREQLRELQADLASGSLSEEQYRESVSELERNLLQDVSSPATKPAARKKNSALIVASAALLPLFAIALYLAVGNPQSLIPQPQATAQAMLQQLQQHLKENPDDAEGWALLASVHFEIERYTDAVSYFEKAVALRPGDAQLLADYADALARANEGRLEGKPVALLEKSLQADPGNIKALALSGAAAYGAGDFKSAADYWQRLLAKMPAESEETKLVQGRIDEARSRAAANTGSNVRGAIRGTVSVSPNLEGQVGPDDTLFVYAQAGDSKMPLSIVRARAKELPYSFVLDDSKGMAGGVKLSSAEEVRVVARISKSGQAQSGSGDLQGVSAGVKPGGSEVKIVIDQVIGAEVRSK